MKEILEITLADNVKARWQDQEGIYHYVEQKKDALPIQSQLVFFGMAYQAAGDEY